MSIPGLGSAELAVTFTPMALDTFEAMLTLLFIDSDHPELHITLYGIGFVILDDFGQCRADCNGDLSINILDALNIVNIILGIIPECPGGNAKTIVTEETVAFLEALKPYFMTGKFQEFMSLVKQMQVPESFSMSQNYPNPFNPCTDIRYQIADGRSSVPTTLRIYNILGQAVRTIVDEPKKPGYYKATWDSRDDDGTQVASGVYFYRLTAGDFNATKRMVLLK